MTGMCGHDLQSRGFWGSFSEDKTKIGGHLVRIIKKKGSFSEDFSLKKKGGHFVRLSILVQNSI